MRLLILAATSGLATGQALAQGSSWDGAYVGVTAGLGGLSPDTSMAMDLERNGRPDGDYTGVTYTPVGGNDSFSGEISSESSGAFGAFGGVTFENNGLVVGAEVKLEMSPIERAMSVGPVRYFVPGPFPSGATFPLPPGTNLPPGGAARVYEERETIGFNFEMDYSLALRGRVGVPVGDNLLLSGVLGVSMAQAQLSVDQDSEQLAAYFYRNAPNGPVFSADFNTSQSSSVSTEETLIGVSVGALAEYQLADNLIARADVTWTKYGDISLSNGAGSEVSIEPSTWSASLGIAFRM